MLVHACAYADVTPCPLSNFLDQNLVPVPIGLWVGKMHVSTRNKVAFVIMIFYIKQLLDNYYKYRFMDVNTCSFLNTDPVFYS